MMDWPDLNAADERAVADFMSSVANLRIPHPGSPSTSPGAGRIPPARQLWWKAELLKTWEAERRALLPLDVMQTIEIAGGVAIAGLALYWSLPLLGLIHL